ncbi:MAG: transposase, partial [Pseudomonadota bacterium]
NAEVVYDRFHVVVKYRREVMDRVRVDQANQLRDDEATARGAWQEWAGMALGSGIDALVRFAKKLEPYMEGIVSSAQHRMNTSVLEGMNNRIKVIKRMAYGCRDTAYFFLKIRAAFPGKVR